MRLSLIESAKTDPYHNLALERYLLENVGDDEVILYLWQNENTVVIGRNQSALSECRIQELNKAGGHLARRLSGGGAVYHDLGNLNFTILAPDSLYDEKKQTCVILKAVDLLGIDAERTGRNDLIADGKKFSGHAYYHTNGKNYHHGTLLVNVDIAKMGKYLNPSPIKLASKGVASVKSRVCNLVDFVPNLDIAHVKDAMKEAFSETYGGELTQLVLGEDAQSIVNDYKEELGGNAWLLKDEHPLQNSSEMRFNWGCVRVDFDEKDGILTEVALYSDGLDADFLNAIPATLRGCKKNTQDIKDALKSLAESQAHMSDSILEITNDIASLLTQ